MSQDWADSKYKPKKYEEIVGNDFTVGRVKTLCESFKEDPKKNPLPNMLLVGRPGVGKSCLAEIVVRDIGAEFREWNGSDERKLEVIRNEVKVFASTKPIDSVIKVAVIEEADGLDGKAQDALRRTMEKFSDNCKYIFTSNDLARMNAGLMSRLKKFDFYDLTPDDIFKRLSQIVIAEKYDNVVTPDQIFVVAERAKGDMRNAIKNLQSLVIGRKLPLSKEEMEAVISRPPPETVSTMMNHALRGRFTESCKELNNLCFRYTTENIFFAIFDEFLKTDMKEEEKVIVAEALAGVHTPEKRYLYGMLAHISAWAMHF